MSEMKNLEENLDARETAIEYCKEVRRDMKNITEMRPISKQMEESFKEICEIPTEENLDKYPELKAEVDKQRKLEDKAIKLWEKEIKKVMKENNLSEEDIKEEEA